MCALRPSDENHTSNERKLPKCMDNRRGRQHNFGTQRRSCFRVCIALAVVSMGALLSFVPAFGRGATVGAQGMDCRSAVRGIVDVLAGQPRARRPVGQRWLARAMLA